MLGCWIGGAQRKMATRKAGKGQARGRSAEEAIFIRKMFAYAFVAMENLPSHRRDGAFLQLAEMVLEHHPEPQRLRRYLDEARARIQQRSEIMGGEIVGSEVVRLDDYRHRYSMMHRD
jgi:hypothetical protein